MVTNSKLLIVSDDRDLRYMLSNLFRPRGYVVETEGDEGRALAGALSGRFDLVVVENGLEWLRRLRAVCDVPVLMLISREDGPLRAFSCGADDCLRMPFAPEELLARVGAILRRVAAGSCPEVLRAGDLELCPAKREAFYEGRRLALTAAECELLAQLMRSLGKAVHRDQLSAALYGRLIMPSERGLDTHVSRLRRKLGEAGRMILSIRGTGYQLRVWRD